MARSLPRPKQLRVVIAFFVGVASLMGGLAAFTACGRPATDSIIALIPWSIGLGITIWAAVSARPRGWPSLLPAVPALLLLLAIVATLVSLPKSIEAERRFATMAEHC